MRNIAPIIADLNKASMKKVGPVSNGFNCRNREECPLYNRCLIKNIEYEAKITNHPNEVMKEYRGLCSTYFREN